MGAWTTNICFSDYVIKSFYFGGFCLKKTHTPIHDETKTWLGFGGGCFGCIL